MTRDRLIGGAVFAGLAILTVWLFIESLNATTPAEIVGYQHTSDPRRIVIILALGRLDDIAEREVAETQDAVRITARKRTSSATADADLQLFPVTVMLRSPLGSRAVLDDKNAAIRDLGTYQAPRPGGGP